MTISRRANTLNVGESSRLPDVYQGIVVREPVGSDSHTSDRASPHFMKIFRVNLQEVVSPTPWTIRGDGPTNDVSSEPQPGAVSWKTGSMGAPGSASKLMPSASSTTSSSGRSSFAIQTPSLESLAESESFELSESRTSAAPAGSLSTMSAPPATGGAWEGLAEPGARHWLLAPASGPVSRGRFPLLWRNHVDLGNFLPPH